MFKLTYLLLLLPYTSYSYTYTETDALDAVEKMNKINVGNECTLENNKTVKHYTPQQAVADINSGNLTFIGRGIINGNGKNSACIYKTERAYIVYNNCSGDKSEYRETDIRVISFNGGIEDIRMMMANPNPQYPNSKIPRSQYDYTWMVAVNPSPPVAMNLNFAQINNYLIKNTDEGCVIGGIDINKISNPKVYCFKDQTDPTWIKSGEDFWKNPGSAWLNAQQKLRETISNTKF